MKQKVAAQETLLVRYWQQHSTGYILYKYTVPRALNRGALGVGHEVKTSEEGQKMTIKAMQRQRERGQLEEAKKMAEGVAGIFSAMQALGVSDPEVESLCQVGAALTQNLSNELDTAMDGKAARHLRAVPVVGSFEAADSTEGEH